MIIWLFHHSLQHTKTFFFLLIWESKTCQGSFTDSNFSEVWLCSLLVAYKILPVRSLLTWMNSKWGLFIIPNILHEILVALFSLYSLQYVYFIRTLTCAVGKWKKFHVILSPKHWKKQFSALHDYPYDLQKSCLTKWAINQYTETLIICIDILTWF